MQIRRTSLYSGDKEEFITHNNYARCLSQLFSDTTLTYKQTVKKAALPLLDTKRNLVGLTLKSLDDERKIVLADKEYSYACTTWLPIKTYYLLFNKLLTIRYIISLQQSSFSATHARCSSDFTSMLESHQLEFNNPLLNQIFDKSLLAYRTSPGANLSIRTPLPETMKLALRKVAKYKDEKWRKDQHINLRRTNDRQKYKTWAEGFRISIFEFPLYMRLRANYRDMAFIENVSTDDTREYFENYLSFALSLYKVLDILERDLVRKRRGL